MQTYASMSTGRIMMLLWCCFAIFSAGVLLHSLAFIVAALKFLSFGFQPFWLFICIIIRDDYEMRWCFWAFLFLRSKIIHVLCLWYLFNFIPALFPSALLPAIRLLRRLFLPMLFYFPVYRLLFVGLVSPIINLIDTLLRSWVRWLVPWRGLDWPGGGMRWLVASQPAVECRFLDLVVASTPSSSSLIKNGCILVLLKRMFFWRNRCTMERLLLRTLR